MKIQGYDIDIEKVARAIREHKYRRVVIQVPEGLKRSVLPVVDFLKHETKTEILVLADPCFGACDLATYKLHDLNVDCVIHIGHLPISICENTDTPTICLNATLDTDVQKMIKKAIPLLIGKHIGLVTTAQHIHTLDPIAVQLRAHGFKPLIGKGDKRIAMNGQILGCNFSAGTSIAKRVDSFLFIGSGMFHPLGLLLCVKKPVVVADPYTNSVKKEEVEELKDTVLRQRYGAIASVQHAEQFGILVGLKPGQHRLNQVNKIKAMLDEQHKKTYILILDTFSPDVLHNFVDIDCFVSTACPRIAIDDYQLYKKPILTPIELEIVLGKKRWDDYRFDEIKSETH
jgi:2-(3-amino-3-carboxypropyl)histidine synthase